MKHTGNTHGNRSAQSRGESSYVKRQAQHSARSVSRGQWQNGARSQGSGGSREVRRDSAQEHAKRALQNKRSHEAQRDSAHQESEGAKAVRAPRGDSPYGVQRAAALLRKKQRIEQNRFLVEGANCVTELLRFQPDRARVIYATAEGLERAREVDHLAQQHAVPIVEVADRAMKTLSDTVTAPGLIAVAEQTHHELPALLSSSTSLEATSQIPIIAVLDEVRDPGNAGTIIRVADAIGAAALILTGDSVEIWNPKLVRSTAGSLFHLPVLHERSFETCIQALHESGITTIATDLQGKSLAQNELVLSRPLAWVFGNEAHGLSPAHISLCKKSFKLPIFGHAESLNLATAASVCLYMSAFARNC